MPRRKGGVVNLLGYHSADIQGAPADAVNRAAELDRLEQYCWRKGMEKWMKNETNGKTHGIFF